MNRYRDVIAEGMVVQDIDSEEQNNVDSPSTEGDFSRRQEKRWPLMIELRYIAGHGDKSKLNKCE